MVISVPGSVECQINLQRWLFLNVALWQVLWLPLVAVVPHCRPELLQALIMDVPERLAPQIPTFQTSVLKENYA